MRFDSFLAPAPEPISAWQRYLTNTTGPTTIRRHHPAPPEPIIAAADRLPARLPHVNSADLAWKSDAACKGQPTDWWVPAHDGRVGVLLPGPSPQAKRICATCTVTTACLAYAVEHREEGYWGGTTEVDRRRIRRNRKRAS